MISNTCCLPLLGFVLLKSLPSRALSRCFQGLSGGTSDLNRSLAPSSATGGHTECVPNSQSSTHSSQKPEGAVRNLAVLQLIPSRSTAPSWQLPVRYQALIREEHQLIKQPINQSIGVLAHGDPRAAQAFPWECSRKENHPLPILPHPSPFHSHLVNMGL